MKINSKSILGTKTLLLLLLLLMIMVQLPFHYTEYQSKNLIKDKIKTQEDIAPYNKLNYENEKEKGLVKIYVFSYSVNKNQKMGCAVFVRHIFLPLYRFQDIHIEGTNKKLDYIHAVTDSKGKNIVEVTNKDIKITFIESTFMRTLLNYLICFILIFLLLTFKAHYNKK